MKLRPVKVKVPIKYCATPASVKKTFLQRRRYVGNIIGWANNNFNNLHSKKSFETKKWGMGKIIGNGEIIDV